MDFTEDPWREIAAAVATTGRRPAYCAIGFLGPKASDVLPLRAGDVLVCDASDSTVKKGGTSPAAIETYLAAGVDVYSCPNLHAKVVVLARRAWIGSMNASANSRDNLIEAAIVTTDGDAVRAARAFVEAHLQRPVSGADIARLQRLAPQQPAFFHTSTPRLPATIPDDLARLALIEVEVVDWTRSAARLAEASRSGAKSKSRTLGSRMTLEALEWPGKTIVRAEMWVLPIWGDEVGPPAYVTDVPSRGRTQLLWLATPTEAGSPITRNTLSAVLRSHGLRLGGAVERRLDGPVVRDIVNLFSSGSGGN